MQDNKEQIEQRKIIHLDMDSFFASVELLELPHLQEKPIAIGSDKPRGVIATCNYAAREFGIHSAMSSLYAKKLCPQIIFIPPNFEKYRAYSSTIRSIMHRYTRFVEPLSLDEAYLDVTQCHMHDNIATQIALALKKDIYQKTGLTSSAGVSINKFLAKVGSDWRKPDGLTVISPHNVKPFVWKLPVRKIPGVGKVTAIKLESMGIKTCADIQHRNKEDLVQTFGKFGNALWQRSHGIDNRSVQTDRQRKSLSVENTYAKDLQTMEEFHRSIKKLFEQLNLRLNKIEKKTAYSGIFIKVKYADFTITTKQKSGGACAPVEFWALLKEALKKNSSPVRLLGIGVSFSAPSAQEKNVEQPMLKLKQSAEF